MLNPEEKKHQAHSPSPQIRHAYEQFCALDESQRIVVETTQRSALNALIEVLDEDYHRESPSHNYSMMRAIIVDGLVARGSDLNTLRLQPSVPQSVLEPLGKCLLFAMQRPSTEAAFLLGSDVFSILVSPTPSSHIQSMIQTDRLGWFTPNDDRNELLQVAFDRRLNPQD